MLILKHESIIHLKQVANKLLLVLHVRKQLLDFRCFFVLRF